MTSIRGHWQVNELMVVLPLFRFFLVVLLRGGSLFVEEMHSTMTSSFIPSCLFLCFSRLTLGSGVFLPNMSREADDWIPVAKCRADCLDALGKKFGMTTMETCLAPFQECGSCWDDCACAYFNPDIKWPVCSPDDRCFAGCRRARSFFRLRKYRAGNQQIRDETSVKGDSSHWQVIPKAVLSDTSVQMNTTLVDQQGNAYAPPNPHLIFSLSFRKSDGIWTQLTQDMRFSHNFTLTNDATECLEGCDLRVVVVDSSGVLTDAVFRMTIPFQLDIIPNVNKSSDTSIAVHFLLTPSDPFVNLSKTMDLLSKINASVTWIVKPREPSARPWSVADDHGSIVIHPEQNQISLLQLKYNSIYDVNITFDSDGFQGFGSATVRTPECANVDGTLTYCYDDQTLFAKVPIWISILSLGVVCGCIALALWIWRLKMRRAQRFIRWRWYRSNPVYTFPRLSSENVKSKADSDSKQRSDIEYSRIQLDISLKSNGRFQVSRAVLDKECYVIKRPDFSRAKTTSEWLLLKDCVFSEIAILKAVRNTGNFVTFFASVDTGRNGTAMLLRWEKNFEPLNEVLQKYRDNAVINGNSLDARFGLPETAFTLKLSPESLRSIASGAAAGLAFLNSRLIVHGAFCANNLLCNPNDHFKVKIHGLSNASKLDVTTQRRYVNLQYSRWLPLEVLNSREAGLTRKTDVWSFGVFIWELLTLGARPYHTGEVNQLVALLGSGYVLEQPATCGNQIYQFMKNCWNLQVESRLQMEEVHDTIQSLMLTWTAASKQVDLTQVNALDTLMDISDNGCTWQSVEIADSVFDGEVLDDDVFASSLRRPNSDSELIPTPATSFMERFFGSKPPTPSSSYVNSAFSQA